MLFKNLIKTKKQRNKKEAEEEILPGSVREMCELAMEINRNNAMQTLGGLPCCLSCFY